MKRIFILILLFSCFMPVCPAHAAGGDTTLVRYWRNGKRMTETVYGVKYQKDKAGKTEIVLGRVRSEKYYSRLDGEELDKEAFDFFYRSFNRHDSIAFYSAKAGTGKSRVQLYFGNRAKGFYFPLHFAANTATERLEENDTLIAGRLYPIKVYERDSLLLQNGDSSKTRFAGAMRSEDYQLFLYANGREELVFDLGALAQKWLGTAAQTGEVVAEAGVTLAEDTRELVRKSAAKGLAFTLANLILLSR